MARKGFKGGMDSLLNGTGTDINDKPAKGRPRTNIHEITKTSQAGTKEGETRATFIMLEKQLELIKALAYWDRVSIRDTLFQAVEQYLATRKNDIQKAHTAYKASKSKE